MRPWISYTLIRLGIFAAAFVILVALQVNVFAAAIAAAVIGLAISYIFFRGLRDRVALDLAARARRAPKSRDDAEEDELDA
ncbi:DUF4229 domain-containing protein [Galbitalea soli]|uniref:DUF4229 domain-containing protein n=1 Tax=Galbitalea soli TaxID=1268042 RepID=A0A7C9PMJ6_9MICO|nr:DUF4229 domain-containing protein [Galbitalea soli]NYJ29700.1 phosphate/sulfate permease [Galbitalea soli]